MKKIITAMFLAQVLLCGAVSAAQQDFDPYALEPSISGGFSASGLFASQEEEDAHLAERAAEELQPCINGDVSESGLFASQSEEDAYTGMLVAN